MNVRIHKNGNCVYIFVCPAQAGTTVEVKKTAREYNEPTNAHLYNKILI
jgi:hypothetical protein